MDQLPNDEQETATSWTNPWIAEYKQRQAMLMEMRPFEVIAMMRDLNLTSYAFSKNAEDFRPTSAVPQIGQNQPFNPDVGDPFGIELAGCWPTFWPRWGRWSQGNGRYCVTSGQTSKWRSPSSSAASTPKNV